MAKRGRWKKIVGVALLVIVVLLAAGITATIGWRPIIGAKARPLTDRKFERTPERMARGKYLVESVMGCLGCHSLADASLPGAPPKHGAEGGGVSWAEAGIPWLVAPNITPDAETGAGNWTDDQLARAIREGIGHDGRALFPIMPYQNYRQMSDEDLASVIVYLRSMPPVRNQLPQTKIPFPLSRLIQGVPQPVEGAVAQPDVSTPVKRGQYLVTISSCADCHTPINERGERLPGMDFAGGFVQKGPAGEVASANITPDATGISYYDEALFLDVMHTGNVKARKLNPLMPWVIYKGMTDDDLKAIFAYLRTVKPIKHLVDNTEPPTPCKLCHYKHGFGERN